MYNNSYGGSGYGYVPPSGNIQYQTPSASYQTPSTVTYNYPQQHQPQPTVVVLNQPTDTGYGHSQPIRNWSSGLCGCCQDCSSCCCAFWCYPCFLCTLAQDMNEFCCGPCCCGAGCGGSGFPNPFLVGMRARMRTKYGIEGSICKDTCCTWCCECCIAMQMARELKHAGNRFR